MPLRLGTVLAHPDDETFGTGGALIRAVRRGVEVHSLCLTKGEQGWMGDPAAPIATRETVGEVRANELREAGRIMGVASVTVRDWGDSQLAQRDPRAVEDDILAWLEEHRPDVLISWGPDGAYGHADHIATGERCLAALAREPRLMPKKIYRFVLYDVWKDALVAHAKEVPEWRDMLSVLKVWPKERLGALLELTDDEIELKWRAMQAHRTQAPDLKNYARIYVVDKGLFRYEAYLRHAPSQDGRLERDLI